MKPGQKITGYWVYWPFHGEEFARRFEKLEDARAYFPAKKSNKGRKLPLGPRLIIRVNWGITDVKTGAGEWRYDPIETMTQGQVDDAFMASAAEAAA